MTNSPHNAPTCMMCRVPMRVAQVIPRRGALPELLVFYCDTCREVEPRDERSAA